MAKLQQIVRNNGSVNTFVNIPSECMEKLGWEKGVGLDITVIKEMDGKQLTEFILQIKKREN